MNSHVETIQTSGRKACMVLAGGGSGAAHALLAQPGASRFILEVQIPYSREAMDEYLGKNPAAYCREQTVRQLCEVAFQRAQRLSGGNAMGIACTAALKTVEERDEVDRAFFGFQTFERQEFHTLGFKDGTRRQQEEELSRSLLGKLAVFLTK